MGSVGGRLQKGKIKVLGFKDSFIREVSLEVSSEALHVTQ